MLGNSTWSGIEPPDGEVSHYAMQWHAYGFPFASVASLWAYEVPAPFYASPARTVEQRGVSIPALAQRLGTPAMGLFPTSPLPLGFALNTLAYFGLIAIPLWITARSRHRWRARHARCVQCGYTIVGLSQCPECGLAVLSMAATPAPAPPRPGELET